MTILQTKGTATLAAVQNMGFSSTSELIIMKGSVPTSFSGLDSYTTDRVSDQLIQFFDIATAYNSSPQPHFLFKGGDEPEATAILSGTATWFWYVLNGTRGALGTIGIIGSGADMEIRDTNIVAGRKYRLGHFYWTLGYRNL